MEVKVFKTTREDFISLNHGTSKKTIDEWLNHWSNYGYAELGSKKFIQCCIKDDKMIDIVVNGYKGRCDILWIYLIE